MTEEYRDAIIEQVWRRARGAESGMLRVLSRGEVEWLLEPLWAAPVDVTETEVPARGVLTAPVCS